MRSINLILLLLQATLTFGQRLDSVASGSVIVYYELYGKGDPVYFLAGGPGMDPDYLLPVINELSDKYLCVLIYQRGTGRTQPAMDRDNFTIDMFSGDIEAVKNKLGHKKFTIFAHSWGGMLAMNYLTRYPDNVSRLILVDSGPFNFEYHNPVDAITARLSVEDLERIECLDTIINMLQKSSVSDKLGKELEYLQTEKFNIRSKGWLFDKSLADKIKVLPGDYNFKVAPLVLGEMHQRNWNLQSLLEKSNADVLIIQGREDPAGPEVSLGIDHALKRSQLHFIEQCGHFPWIEQPAEFFNTVDSFLNSKHN